MCFAELGDEADFLRFSVLLQIRKPHAGALMQDRAQVAQVQKLLREQVGAVAFDERDESVPFAFGGEAFDNAQPQGAAVGEPAIELRLRSDPATLRRASHRTGAMIWNCELAFGGALVVPAFGRGDQRSDDRLVTAGEEAVVFGDGAGADWVVGFHRLGDVEQLARFADEAEARQPAEQVVEQLAERAGADDAARLAAF